MALITGLVSVTFRQLYTREITRLVVQAGLQGVEWGGDVHVPPGNLNLAREVRKQTEDAGLAVISYGSYFRAGVTDEDWPTILNTAYALGAPNIRVWAGAVGSADTDGTARARIVRTLQNAAESAQSARIRVSVEYHANTLTDTPESAARLLTEVDHPNFYSYWQPAVTPTPDERDASLAALIDRVTNVHVFQWVQGTADRLPLADGAAEWRRYISRLKASHGNHALLMEFVRHDSPERFLADAAELQRWLAAV